MLERAAMVPHAVMVLAAGLGTRLRPLTDRCAKPMVPIGDRAAIAHVVDHVRSRLREVTVVANVHHRPEELVAWAASAAVRVSVEEQLLGTAGGLAHAASLLGDGDVLVWNGDILSPLDPASLAAAHRASSACATLAVRPLPAGQGNVGFDDRGRVLRLRNESFGREIRGGEFLGIHVVSAALRQRLPRSGCLVGDVYLPALRAGAPLAVYASEAPFVDVGTRASYLDANLAWLDARGGASFVDRGAEVSAAVERSIVGRGARVTIPLVRCVVWPFAQATEALGPSLHDCVVTADGAVRVPR